LLTKYKKLMKPDCEVIEHLAGVRPATKDRRPFLGLHPKFSQLAIFNGMGSKGVSLAPYFAKEMADFLLSEKELNPEVNINRYVSFYTE
jgi:glycine/D-amino acid oxidase-like deaminating enzyme